MCFGTLSITVRCNCLLGRMATEFGLVWPLRLEAIKLLTKRIEGGGKKLDAKRRALMLFRTSYGVLGTHSHPRPALATRIRNLKSQFRGARSLRSEREFNDIARVTWKASQQVGQFSGIRIAAPSPSASSKIRTLRIDAIPHDTVTIVLKAAGNYETTCHAA